MTVDTQRRIDRFVGIPLCLAAALWTMLFEKLRPRIPETTVRSICVMKFFGLGSIVLSGPFLRDLRQKYPEARIHYITFAHNAEALSFFPAVDEVSSISTATGWRFVRDTIRAIVRMRADQVDTVFDLEFFSKFSTLLGTLSGARRRVGFALPTLWRRWNLTASVPLDRSAHVSAMFRRQLDPSLETPHEAGTFPPITSRPNDRVSMTEKLGLANERGPIIVVNINADAVSLERRWSPERFATVVAATAAARPGATFFLSGTRTEHAYVEEMIARWELSGNVRNVAGVLSLGEFVALLEASDALLTCDSGPAHLASAVGTPVVALFGPESPAFYGPLGESVTLYSGISCSPCLNIYAAKRFVCPYNARCMDLITVSDVADALRRVLENPRVFSTSVRPPQSVTEGS